MDQARARLAIAALLCAPAFGAPSDFEAADVHAAAHNAAAALETQFYRGRYEVRNATVLDLIRIAWDIEPELIFGGPGWLDRDRFHIVAKAPPESTATERHTMLRGLLADRFKLVMHNEARPTEVFALTLVRKTGALHDAAGPGEPACRAQSPAHASSTGEGELLVDCVKVTMGDFGKELRRVAGGFVTYPVVDLTGLAGKYDFTIRWPGQPVAGSFFGGIEKQLGLRLALEKRSVPGIVVDSVNATPTPNAPGVLTKLPPVPSEFEVAEISPSKPGTQPGGGVRPGGRIDIRGVTLRDLIELGWDVTDQAMVTGPRWIDTERYDLVARAPDGMANSSKPTDPLRQMLRTLLIDRFKMAVHNESRPMPVWLLTVSKRGLNLKVADPATRSGCRRSAGETGSGEAALAAVVYSCRNTSMAQLADEMHQVAAAYVDHPAVDATGLKGGYDFTITWNPKGVIAAVPAAADPSGGTTFFQALEKLGLHLEGGQKRPMPVMVIDRAEKITAKN